MPDEINRDKINPWLLRRPQSPSSAARPEDRGAPIHSGPAAPQRGGRVPAPVLRLPVNEQYGTPAELWVVGVHGGSGESTIAALHPEWVAAGHGLPATIPSINRQDGPDRLLLTCRSHVPGLLAAQAALTQWAGGGADWLQLLGLVIIADAPGKLPRPVRELADVVAGGAPRCWRLPWSEAWRLGDSPPLAELPRAVRQLVSDVSALVCPSDPVDRESPNSLSLEGIHHASPRDDHPVRPSLRGPHPAADPW